MMKGLVSCLAMALLCAAAAPAAAGRPADKDMQRLQADMQVLVQRKAQLTAAPADRGCFGKDAVTCMASLSFAIQVSTAPPGMPGELHLPKPVERNIYGKAVPQSVEFLVMVTPTGRPSSETMAILTTLSLADGEHVDMIEFDLPHQPLFAKTKQDWDATGVYELAVSALGVDCVGQDRLAFYQAYDKAQRQESSRRYDDNSRDPNITDSQGGSMTVCGKVLSTRDYTTVTRASGGDGAYFYIYDPAKDAANPALKK